MIQQRKRRTNPPATKCLDDFAGSHVLVSGAGAAGATMVDILDSLLWLAD